MGRQMPGFRTEMQKQVFWMDVRDVVMLDVRHECKSGSTRLSDEGAAGRARYVIRFEGCP